MSIEPDGDIVRGLGYVSFHSTRLEAQVNRVFETYSFKKEFPDEARRHPISQRLGAAIRHAELLEGPKGGELLAALLEAKMLLKRRNEVLHGCIYDAPYPNEGNLLHSTIPGVEAVDVSAKSMYTLAEDVSSCQSRMDRWTPGAVRELAGVNPDDA